MDMDEGFVTKLWLEGYEISKSQIPSDQSHYHSKKFKLHKKELDIISLFLKKNRIQWNVLIHAAWGVLLNRFSSSDFIIYGNGISHTAKSNSLKIHQSIMPVESSINDKTSVKAFINQIKTQLNKKNHSKTQSNNKHISYEFRYLLLSKSDKPKLKSRQPLLLIETNSNQFPLIFHTDKKVSNSFSIFYNPALFTEEYIDSVFNHFKILLLEISKDINQKIIKLNLLTNEEYKTILLNWSKPTYQFPIKNMPGCIHDLFTQQAKKSPNHLAVNHNNTNVIYRELDNASNVLAHQLTEKGVKLGDRICVLMERTPTLLMAMLAIYKLGAIYVPINPKYPDERVEYILEDSDAKVILTNNLEKLSIKHRSKAVILDETWKTLNHKNQINPSLPSVDPEQIAYIIYTSGTTGQPKGVMIRHKSLTNLVTWYQGCFNVTQNDRSAQFASQGFDTFLCETIPYLALGASIHIVDDNIKLTPSLFFSWLKDQKITICDLPTSYAQMLLSMTWPKDIALKTMKIGGESFTHQPAQIFPFDIWIGYGPTEATIECTYIKIYGANSQPQLATKHLPSPIGKSIINTEAYVVDKYFQPVPVGICGELLIGGVCVSTGYLNRDELTEEKFIPHLFNKNKNEKLYRTGDLVRWSSNGNLEFIGRIDHQIKIRGYRVELGDVENAISQHSDVNEVVVLAKENLNGEKSLIAYVVPNLDKERYLYQERCLLSVNNNKFIEAITEDISKEGVALSAITEAIEVGHLVQLHLKLPGFTEQKLFSGHVIWQHDNRCGIYFDLNEEDKFIISKSIDYYLSTHNVMELVLSASAKRSLRKALRKQLPEYMVPSVFVTLMQFPLTFSGKIDLRALPPPQDYEQMLQKEFIAPKTATEKKLALIWNKLLGKNNISMSDNFFDLGGTSLTAAELSVEILNQFKKSIPTKILFDLPYIPILASYIDTKGKEYNTSSIVQEEIERDCKLHENIIPNKKLSQHINNPQNILLTGAGGFLGIYILRELLKTTQAKIYCIIRKGEFETAAKRLISTIEKFSLSNDITLADRRIIAIAGDISFDNFGLPLEQYNSLVGKIDLIYHCGAQVNIMTSYNKLRGSNVQGTLEVIKFAVNQIDKPIHYISTLSSAYRKDEAGYLAEVFPDENYDELFGGYAISKWVSERLLTEISRRGLPISIYRSGYISGQSDTGISNLNDALFMLIKGCIQLGYAPKMKEKITILPVDFVSKSIITLSLAHPDTATVYHVDHPIGISWTDLITWLNNYGYAIKIISMKQWKEKLITISKENALFPFLPYYLAIPDDYQPTNVSVKNTSNELKRLGLNYPDIDDKLLTMYFDYLYRINFLPPPDRSKKSIIMTQT